MYTLLFSYTNTVSLSLCTQADLSEQQATLELKMRHRATDFGRLYEVSTSLAKDNDHTAK